MLKLKLQYFGHLMRGANSLENALMLGMIEGRRRRQIESTYNAGDPGLIPGLGRSAGEGKKLPTSVFWPGELIHVISKSQRGLSNFHFNFGTSQVALVVKKSVCQSRRLGFNPWVRKIPWRRKWQPTPVFLPGESHGQRSLAAYIP